MDFIRRLRSAMVFPLSYDRLYFGMRFCRTIRGVGDAGVAPVEGNASLTAWLAHRGAEHQLALINKGEAAVDVQLTGAGKKYHAGHAMRLSGPALDAKEGVTLAEMRAPTSSGLFRWWGTRRFCSVGSRPKQRWRCA